MTPNDHDEDDPPRRVIFVRHGRTAWNAEGRWQGREDVPLDAVGLRQAEVAAVALARDGSISRLVTSPARRAAQTASVLLGAFDLAGRPLIRATDERLVEVDMGLWSGLTHDDVPYGSSGERLSAASRRVGEAVVELVATCSTDTFLLVGSERAHRISSDRAGLGRSGGWTARFG